MHHIVSIADYTRQFPGPVLKLPYMNKPISSTDFLLRLAFIGMVKRVNTHLNRTLSFDWMHFQSVFNQLPSYVISSRTHFTEWFHFIVSTHIQSAQIMIKFDIFFQKFKISQAITAIKGLK